MQPSRCPFCGSETAPHLHSTQDPDVTRKAHWVCCHQSSLGCGACGPVRDSEVGAITAWGVPSILRGTVVMYKHLKTGNIYQKLIETTDSTNATDGQRRIVYIKDGDPEVYDREETEFYEKFERLPEAHP